MELHSDLAIPWSLAFWYGFVLFVSINVLIIVYVVGHIIDSWIHREADRVIGRKD